MKFGIVYYWRDPIEILLLAQDFMEIRVFENDILDGYTMWKEKIKELRRDWDDDITIHMPEYFEHPDTGELTLVDLACEDPEIHEMSLDVMRSLISFANSIDAKKILIHPGGITKIHPEGEQTRKLQLLQESLTALADMDFTGEMLLENMPWFYWKHDGSRWYSSICTKPDDFEKLLKYCDGIILDTSHAYLSETDGSNKHIHEFLDRFNDHINYLHVSDALPPDNEGMQIGEGNTDFETIFKTLDRNKLWIIPEIWKGHENFGEGFSTAIERINDLL